MQQFSLAIHGGAGTILKQDMTADLEKAYIKGLEEALAGRLCCIGRRRIGSKCCKGFHCCFRR